MTLQRFAQRRDANQGPLVDAARELGAQWEQFGPLDGWIGWRGAWFPVEIKLPDGPRGGRSDRHYTPAQVKFIARCKEHNTPVHTWRNLIDVMVSLNAAVSA